MEDNPMPLQVSEEIVKQIEEETDPAKIAALTKILNELIFAEERKKVKDRLGIPQDNQAA